MTQPEPKPHLLLLLTSRTYRAEAFLQAAARLGVEVTVGVEAGSIQQPGPGQIQLDFRNIEQGTTAIQSLHATRPLSSVISAEDEGALIAAGAAETLGLPHSTLESVLSARDKLRMRKRLQGSQLPSPPFWDVPIDAETKLHNNN